MWRVGFRGTLKSCLRTGMVPQVCGQVLREVNAAEPMTRILELFLVPSPNRVPLKGFSKSVLLGLL